MVGLNKPLSVRLTDEDAVFLAGLQLEDATTASDKVRALIKLARLRGQTPASPQTALAMSHDLLGEPLRAVREAEEKTERHSDVVIELLTAVEDLMALAVLAPAEFAEADADRMGRYETRLVDRAARLTEHLMRWAVTPTAPAYDPAVVARRIARLTELMRLISNGQPAQAQT